MRPRVFEFATSVARAEVAKCVPIRVRWALRDVIARQRAARSFCADTKRRVFSRRPVRPFCHAKQGFSFRKSLSCVSALARSSDNPKPCTVSETLLHAGLRSFAPRSPSRCEIEFATFSPRALVAIVALATPRREREDKMNRIDEMLFMRFSMSILSKEYCG